MLTSVRSYLPPQRLTNHELAALYEGWSADKIYEKTGIRERRVVAPEVCASDLAYAAAAQLLEGNDPGGIDALIFCTQTPDYFLPTTASLLQERLRLSQRCAAFDLNQGCSGYIYSLAVASGMIASGLAARVLLATADTYTRLIHPLDKSTRTLFGDAGTASLLEAGAKSRLHGFVFGTDGRGANNLIVRAGGFRASPVPADREETDASGNVRTPASLFMDGPQIFNFANRVVPETVEKVLAAGRLGRGDIDLFVFHQANRYLLEHLQRKLAIPRERFVIDVEHTGNTVSSSIPLAIDRARHAGVLRAGMRVMLVGFGVGYSWGGCIWETAND